MNTFDLSHPLALAEVEPLLLGRTITSVSVKKDGKGGSSATFIIAMSDGSSMTFVARPLQQFVITADVALPQFVGAGDSPPPDLAEFKLRAVA